LHQGNHGCVRLVQYYLDRIAAHRHLNAFIEVFTEESLRKAADIDESVRLGKKLGSLAGLVIGIKDLICYKDHRVSAASRMLENFISLYSATAVERLLAEDAIIIGRLNCDEFAMGSSTENSVYGRVINALNADRVPGGSSGGSAVAVQAGLCMASLGTDTGGSVRQPADFCGIIGLKPTYGRVSRSGLIAYASSFDQIGIFGRNIDYVGGILGVIAGEDELDSTATPIQVADYQSVKDNLNHYRIASLQDALLHEGLDLEIKDKFDMLFSRLHAAGHLVETVDFEYMEYLAPAYYILTTAEASSNLARYDGLKYGYCSENPNSELIDLYRVNRSQGFGREVKRRIMLGTFVLSAGYYEAYYSRAQKVRRLVADKTDEIFSKYDYIIMPNSPTTAFRVGEKIKDPVSMYLADIYTVFANLAGIPAISIPLFTHSDGMPFGAQVMGKKFDEAGLLQVSRYLMDFYHEMS